VNELTVWLNNVIRTTQDTAANPEINSSGLARLTGKPSNGLVAYSGLSHSAVMGLRSTRRSL
jgi:hypothetical protein